MATRTHWNLGARTYAESPWIDSALAEQAAKEYGREHGYFGAVGGWIYKAISQGAASRGHGTAVVQGWFNFWTMFRRPIEDHYTRKLTAFASFDNLVNVPGHYRPTILVRDNPQDWRQAYLANAYDVYQGAAFRRDPRRAHTGYPVDGPAPAVRPIPVWLSRAAAGVKSRG